MCILCAANGLRNWSTGSVTAISPTAGAATSTSGGATGAPTVDGLLSGHRWTGAITYSFPNSPYAYEAGITEAANGFAPVSFAQAQAARYVLEGRSAYAGGPKMTMTAFEQFTNASVSDAGFGGADLRIAGSASANPTAYAYFPSTDPRGGDVWFGTSHSYANPRVGTYEYATMVHELGHALGLKHAHEAGGVSNVAVPGDWDSMEFTVMTYRSYVGQTPNGYTNETFGFAQTFMMLDIAALQAMYGANYATQSGNSVYRWSPTTGEAFINGVGQGAPGGGAGGSANRVFLTVWDGGGIDTYDFSNYATNLRVNLAPGGWSTLSATQLANLGDGRYARGNVFNALQANGDARSLIENAIGGSGSDSIVGNAVANALTGGAGDDSLRGGGASDVLNGGLGTDTAVYGAQRTSYAVTREADGSVRVADLRAGAPEGADTVLGIEKIQFADGTYLVQDLLNGTLTTNGDPTSTQPGLQTISFAGNPTAVIVDLPSQAAWNGTSTIKLTATGNAVGSSFADKLWGDGNDNVLNGGNGGADEIRGGLGSDTVSYQGTSRGVIVDLGSQLTADGLVNDRLSSIENATGSALSDKLWGTAAANVLKGLEGNDELIGGSGADDLYGGAGADRFVYAAPSHSLLGASDVIHDFQTGIDRLDLTRIDADFTRIGDQAFTYLGSGAFRGSPGELRFESGALTADVDGDGVADLRIMISGLTTFAAADILL